MGAYRLKMEDINKEFPGVKALDHAVLRVRPGSVHFLIGENGAGKSTLMKCLFGIYKMDQGTIELDGKPVKIPDTQTALRMGISMIHQELNPIPHQTVTDNIWVGRHKKRGIVVDEKLMYRKTKELLQMLEFNINPNAAAGDLPVAELQALEIAKAVSMEARLIIMDEPTSSLTVGEVEHLFKLIRRLKAEGRSIVYISHKLEEMHQIADEVTVMRDGKYIDTWDVKEITVDELITQMVGRKMDERFPEGQKRSSEEVMLKLEAFTSANERSFRDISFELRKGEILGIGGLVGAQRTELVESIFGLRPIKSGKIYKAGKEIRVHSPNQAIKHGFALLTEERRATGIVPMLSVLDNALIAVYGKFANKLSFINKKGSMKAANDICVRMGVRTPSMHTEIKNLSGGNQQKVLVGRWLLTNSNILIMDEPTRGIDVGAKYEIYKIMRELVDQGNSVIMVSSEMPELIGMSDRVIVMCEGRQMGILGQEEVTQTSIMRLATNF